METSSGRFKLTVNCQGIELQGNCICGKNSMIIFLDSPRFFNRILLSAKVALPAVQDSEQVEKLAKDLLIEMYTDYELLARHKKELKAALIEFDRKRDKLIAQNKEAEANTLLSGMIQEIIGKRCCFDDLEEVAEKIAFELD